MAATPAGASRTLRHPDAGLSEDEDERSIWERMADGDLAGTDDEPEPATHDAGPEDPGPVAVIPGQERVEDSPAAPTATPDPEPAPAKRRLRKRKVEKAKAKSETTRPRRSWREYRAPIVAGVVVLALLAGVIVFGLQWFGQRGQDAEQDAASASARQIAVNLTSLDYNTIDAQVKQIIDETTGDFRNQFTQNADSFSNVVRVAKVQTTSDVVGSGVQSIGDGKARVLVAVRSTVKNTQAPQGDVRNYRMALDLQDQGGQWLTSNVEFVP